MDKGTRKKILFLASWYPKDDHDPTGRFILEQAKAVQNYGPCDVDVIDCSIQFPIIPMSWQIAWKTYQIKKKLKKSKVDIVHAHVAFPAGVIALNLKKKIPTISAVLTEHTGPLQLLEKYFPSSEDFYKHFSLYDLVITVSPFLEQQLLARAPDLKVAIVGNIVNERFFNTHLQPSQTQNKAAFVGRLEKPKGIVDLVESLKIFDSRSKNNLELYVLGEGRLLKYFNEATRSFKHVQVNFLTPDSHNTPLKILSDTDFLILPSQYETFSLVAAEALALGKPVFGFKCGGPESFLKEDGILVAQKEYHQMADLLESALQDTKWQARKKEMLERRTRIESEFSARAIGTKLKNIYNNL